MDIEELVRAHLEKRFFTADDIARAIRAALTEMAAGYEEQLEVERMRLAACGVIAMSNTAESAANARQMLPEYWSASAKDCANAVDREMALRERIRQLSETHAIELRAYEATVANLEAKVRELEVERDGMALPRRCHLCGYQHGHQIGCENNTIDISLKAETNNGH